jgi:hypothetical protein
MKPPTLVCGDRRRRNEVRKRDLNGLDYVEVSDDGRTLTLYFLGKAPRDIEPGNVLIEGGRRITDLVAIGVTPHYSEDPELDDRLEVQLDRGGDFSTYTVRMVERDQHGRPTAQPMRGFDRRYSEAAVSFGANCDTHLDCAAPVPCPTPEPQAPAIDYLAKDYLGFRRLMLDRLAVLIPEWRERHVPDLGIALVELLAYVGDHLSYYQDAVATEAYLEPARERISVRRHARLVDYRLHEGCNARAFVCVVTDADLSFERDRCFFITAYEGAPPADQPLSAAGLSSVPRESYEVFEPLRGTAGPILLRRGHSRIRFYTWGDRECCLPRGATSVTLLDEWEAGAPQGQDERPVALRPNDLLLLEEVRGPRTGDPADADPSRRQVVRLTRVHRDVDRLTGTHIVDVEWSAEDALRFALCISSTGRPPECKPLGDVSVACGNVLVVDHGRTLAPPEDLGQVPGRPLPTTCDPCDETGGGFVAGRYRPRLTGTPLTFGEPAPPHAPAVRLLDQDPRRAVPHVGLQVIPPLPDHSGPLFTSRELGDPALLIAALRDPPNDRARELRARRSPATVALLHGDAGDPSPALVDALRGELTGWLEAWSPEFDLLSSQGDDRHFVVETDNEGIAQLRFGDGDLGRAPEVGAEMLATYRVGNGPAGNVGAETITRLVLVGEQVSGVALQVRNPLAARGGTPPESIAEAKLMAPGAFQSELARAITPADYAALAQGDPRIQGAAVTLAWTGSWYEVQVAVDQIGEEAAEPSLCDRTRARLERFRRIGHDLRVAGARLVPIDLALVVCVLPHFGRGEVKRALLEVLGTGRLADGRLGFFHPDSLEFGGAIELSRIVAAAQAVPGVESVTVERLERLFEGPDFELEEGVLRLAPDEIARLSNDPSFPEHGRLRLTLRGGR